MYYNSLNKIIVALWISFFGSVVCAVESGGEEPQVAKIPVPAEEDFRKQTSEVNSAKEQVRSLTKEIQEKIKIKNRIHKASKKREIVYEIVNLHNQLKEQIKKYNQHRRNLKYRFPEKGEDIERNYLPARVQTLEEIESGIGLEADLSKVSKKIEKKYAPFVSQEEAVRHKAKQMRKNLIENKGNDKRERVRLEK